MAKHEYEKPWQVMPAKIIKLALEHAQKEDDFDQQVAFLLLDVGVEAALKTYLVNRGQDVERIVFPDLIKKVKEELPKTNPDLVEQLDDVSHFHKVRNQIYHEGGRTMATKDNLRRYSDLAKRVAEEVLGINLETERKYVILLWGEEHELEELIDIIETRFRYFHESCALIVEKVRPAYATREFEVKYKSILHRWPDIDDEDIERRLDMRKLRLEKFCELTAMDEIDSNIVDTLLEDINFFYMMIASSHVSENWKDDFTEYMHFEHWRSRLLKEWRLRDKHGFQEPADFSQKLENIISWVRRWQKRMDVWINSHIDDIYRRRKGFDFLDFEVLWEDLE